MPDYPKRKTSFSSPEEARESETNGALEGPELPVFRADREGIRKVLGDLEAEIMEYLWEQSTSSGKGISVREVYEAFRLRRSIAYTTLLSTMTRLSKKHLLWVQKEEAAYLYTPVFSKESLIEKVVSSLLENLLVSFSQTTQAQVRRLVTPESLQRLNALKEHLAELRGVPASSEGCTVTDPNAMAGQDPEEEASDA